MGSPSSSVNTIHTIDMSTLFMHDDEGHEMREILKQACSEYGLFQLVNHGVPLNLINQAMEQCKEFFDLPNEEKLKFQHHMSPDAYEVPIPHGYYKHPAAKNEDLVMCPTTNSLLTTQPELKQVMNELMGKLRETCELLEGFVNDCLGLPPNFLKEHNNDRSLDILLTVRYFPALGQEEYGCAFHQDPNIFTLIFQDNIGGLQLLKDDQWIPVTPIQGALVFHLSDIIQVLTNNKFKSPFHQVVSPMGKSRYAFVFFYNLNRQQWVKPLPKFAEEIGEPPKYRRFQYKDYFDVRLKEKLNPPARPQDKTRLIPFASII